MKNNSLIKIKNVYKKYDKRYVIDNLSLEFSAKKFTAIMGASGSGKTTLLNMISTLYTHTKEKIFVNENEITNLSDAEKAEFRKRKIGFVFQNYRLLKSLTIRENIAIPLSLLNINAEKINTMIEEMSKNFGINEQLNKYPYELSGGQQQRAAIIRAIIKSPELIIADEPTGALDSQSAKNIMEYLKMTNEKYKTSILMVTHDSLSASYADEVIFIKDGKVAQKVVKKEIHGNYQKILADTLVNIEDRRN